MVEVVATVLAPPDDSVPPVGITTELAPPVVGIPPVSADVIWTEVPPCALDAIANVPPPTVALTTDSPPLAAPTELR